jgi:F-type H+-transporting ATPase subunit b
MLIDWFTVGAQVVNFLILVWLLKRLLYKPILDAIDAREKRIAAELADANSRKTEATKERDEYLRKNAEFDNQRALLASHAAEEAKTERQRLLDEARRDADALSAKRRERLRDDASNLNQAIGLRIQQEVFAVTRKALTDLASASLEERIAEVFIRRLKELDGNAKTVIADALKGASWCALIRTAFNLPAKERASIQTALNDTFCADVQLRFEVEPHLIGGIELTANGQKLGWSIAEYVTSLERSIGTALQTRSGPEPHAP